MSRGINKVILIGNLGADPEVRYTPSGTAVANIRLATSEQWKDRNTGEAREHTEWHRVAMFSKLGEIAGQYLRKGSKVYIEGRIRTNKWQDQGGQDRYSTEIVADNMQMLDSRGGGAGGGGTAFLDQPGSSQPQRDGGNAPAAPAAPATSATPAGPPTGGSVPDFDDDIPF